MQFDTMPSFDEVNKLSFVSRFGIFIDFIKTLTFI